MSLHTNLKGRLRNTTLPKSNGLMPVFEAVVNSIHAIEEKGNLSQGGKITLKINRSKQTSFEQQKILEPIIGFTISDNGCGFDDTNLTSFETLDSDHKIDKGCHGVGRLMWLKAFNYVDIASYYRETTGSVYKRTFSFDQSKGVYGESSVSSPERNSGTNIELKGFNDAYRKSVPKTHEAIATHLLEHCLWYFVRAEGVPDIVVKDGSNSIKLSDLYDSYMHDRAFHESISIQDQRFELTHIKLRVIAKKKHQLALCADSRLVKEENIHGKLPGLYGRISDSNGEFTYTCYVSSSYLDENVRADRTSFDLAENNEGLFDNAEISIQKIREEVLKRTEIYLGDVLAGNVAEAVKRVEDFISTQAPRYRPITNYMQLDQLSVDPDISDKDLELHLHKHWYKLERDLVNEGHDIMLPSNEEHLQEYQMRLQSYLQKAEDLKTSDLANYVFHRKTIIDLLAKSIERQEDGNYAREDMIHELIMPMRKDSSEVFLDSCNLWLIDERLAFHNYLASDKTIKSMPISESIATKEPDLLSLKFFDNPILINDQKTFPLGSITVIEIKRPMRNDMKGGEEKDPIDQALGYLERIRDGKVLTNSGRPIPRSNEIPGYCYVLCDLTPSMQKRCRRANLRETSDGMGYFGYNEPSHAYIEVISFDQLVKSATERNSAFFDKLGLPSS